MKPQEIRIVAAVVDTAQLMLYKEDGSTITIPQGDPRLRRILEVATPQLIMQGYADVVIDSPEENSYVNFEKEGSGAVKFFRIAKSKLKNLFGAPEEAPNTSPVPVMNIGAIPPAPVVHNNLADAIADAEANVAAFNVMTAQAALLTDAGIPAVYDTVSTLPATVLVQQDDSEQEVFPDQEKTEEYVTQDAPTPEVAKAMSVIDEIMLHAVPVSSPDFHEEGLDKQANVVEGNGYTPGKEVETESEDTMIAVVDGQIIPGVEKIKTQFGRAAKMGSTIGVERFLQRLASVIDKRQHSVDDLLKFMERGDMPIADDGSVIIYKVLNRRSEGTYVDCHTKSVEQWVGAYVCMAPEMVDHNRRTECSNGLHVARRGYISHFSGDVCVLAKLSPEDVIAVPHGDINKMRVCGYHILHELTAEQYALLNANKPITNTEEGKKLLAKVLKGEHVQRTDEVRITGSHGTGVISTKLTTIKPEKKVEITPEVVAATMALDNPDKEQLDEATDPKEVIQKVEQEQKAVLSRKEQAKLLYDACADGTQESVDALHAFKKASKTSWEKLGLPELNGGTFSIKAIESTAAKGTAKQKAKAKTQAKKSKKAAKKAPVKVVKSPSPVTKEDDVIIPPQEFKAPAVVDMPSEGSARERIQKLLAIGLGSFGVGQQIIDIKRKSKKSWEVLGVSSDIVAQLNAYQTKP